jgi:hypothetical protein
LLKTGFLRAGKGAENTKEKSRQCFYVQGSGALGYPCQGFFFFPKFLKNVHWRGSRALISIKMAMAMAIVLGAL